MEIRDIYYICIYMCIVIFYYVPHARLRITWERDELPFKLAGVALTNAADSSIAHTP